MSDDMCILVTVTARIDIDHAQMQVNSNYVNHPAHVDH